MYYYERLRELREKKGLLQKDIAKVLNTNERQYGRWETGFTEIPTHHLITLSSLYETSIDYILKTTDIREPYLKSKK